MEALVISPDFIIEDIHKNREQNYARTKDMTADIVRSLTIIFDQLRC